jgi:hypothetical protein
MTGSGLMTESGLVVGALPTDGHANTGFHFGFLWKFLEVPG